MEPGEYETIAQLEGRHWWYQGMRAVAQTVVAYLPLPSEAAILDAGCGMGGNAAWLTSHGTVAAVDSSRSAVAHTARQGRARTALASVVALPFPPGTFHLVASFDVLYHRAVPDDGAALRESARVLKPGGWLVMRLPAHRWLRGAHDAQVHTARRYGARELRRKLRAAGFYIEHQTPVGLWLLPGAMLRRGLKALRGNHRLPASDLHMPPRPVNALLAGALALEGRVAARHRLPWGLSLFAVARKGSDPQCVIRTS